VANAGGQHAFAAEVLAMSDDKREAPGFVGLIGEFHETCGCQKST
jgi:hypothetical protein